MQGSDNASVRQMNPFSRQIVDIHLAAGPQDPECFIQKAPPALHVLQDHKVHNHVEGSIRKPAQIGRVPLDEPRAGQAPAPLPFPAAPA